MSQSGDAARPEPLHGELVPARPQVVYVRPAPTMEDLQRQLGQLLDRFEGATSTPSPPPAVDTSVPVPTFREVFERYAAMVPGRLCEKAALEHKRVTELFCAFQPRADEPPFGDRRCNELRSFHLMEFIAAQGDLAAWTKRRFASIIRSPLNAAARLGLIEANPFPALGLPMGNVGRDWTDAEYQAILRESPPHFRRFIIFIRFSGARPGEARTMQWSDVDAVSNVIVLWKHKTMEKTKTARRIRINKVTVKLLLWLKRHQHVDETFVFLNGIGEPWSIAALCRRMRDLRRRAGLPEECRMHGFRHGFATKAIANGVDLATVSTLMGHASIVTTMRYVHLVNKSDHLDRASRKAVGIEEGEEVSQADISELGKVAPEPGKTRKRRRRQRVRRSYPRNTKLKPSERAAWESYQLAVETVPELAAGPDRAVHVWLLENGDQLPPFETFSRYIRSARRLMEISKRADETRDESGTVTTNAT